MARRGVREAGALGVFLSSQFSDLSDPYRLRGMEAAVPRFLAALDQRERVLLHGDYDVDGVCSTAILALALRRLGLACDTYVPDRLTEGYGVSAQAVRLARERGVRLLVTLDCGIVAHDELEEARRAGIDCIVIDHHLLSERGLPQALAVINPKQEGRSSPGHEFCATGLAFKVAQALLGEPAQEFLGLAALGTVADHAPLLGDNRIFVKRGLERLSSSRHAGIAALLALGRLAEKRLTVHDLSFQLAPRINAVCRLGSAHTALDLLLCEQPEEALKLAQELERENRNRQSIERRAYGQAVRKVEREVAFARDRVIVVWDEGWHPGVVGILAARLARRFSRPAFVAGSYAGTWRGSARSVAGFDVAGALALAREHLEEFGGHEAAAGFTARPENFEALRRALNAGARTSAGGGESGEPLEPDAEVALGALNESFWRDLARLEPFGVGNPRPVFLTRSLTVQQILRRTAKSVAFRVADRSGEMMCRLSLDVFRMPEEGMAFDLVYSPHGSVERGIESVWLEAKRWAPASLSSV